MTTKYHTLKRLPLSGLSYHQYPFYVEVLVPGVELSLQRDALNVHDPNGIRVLYDGEQIGWIPKAENEVLARLLDLEIDLACRIISHDLKATLDRRLYVGIYIGVAE